MKTQLTVFLVFAILTHAANAADTPAPAATPYIAISWLDDFTDQKNLAIVDPLSPDAARLLIGGAHGRATVLLTHRLVQAEQPEKPVRCRRDGFQFKLPTPPEPSLPIEEFEKQSLSFRKALVEVAQKRIEWMQHTQGEMDATIRAFLTAQGEMQTAYLKKVEALGHDVAISNVADAIIAAAAGDFPADATHKFLVVASDAKDEPSGKAPLRKAFSTEELPASITLVFLNQTGTPQQESIFAGLPNPVMTAASAHDAVSAVLRVVGLPLPASNTATATK